MQTLFDQISKKHPRLTFADFQEIIKSFDDEESLSYILGYKKKHIKDLSYVNLFSLRKRWEGWVALLKKKQKTCVSLEKQGQLTEENQQKIDSFVSNEDLKLWLREKFPPTLPQAQSARSLGLQPLFEWIMDQGKTDSSNETLEQKAKEFIIDEPKLDSVRAVINAVQFIIVEYCLNEKEMNTWTEEAIKNGNIKVTFSETPPKKLEKWTDYSESGQQFFKKISGSKYLELRSAWRKRLLKVVPDVEIKSLCNKIYSTLNPLDNLKVRGLLYGAAEMAVVQRLIPKWIQAYHRNLENEVIEKEVERFSLALSSVLVSSNLENSPILGVFPMEKGFALSLVNAQGQFVSGLRVDSCDEITDSIINLFRDVLKNLPTEYVVVGYNRFASKVHRFLSQLIEKAKLNVSLLWGHDVGFLLYTKDIAQIDLPNEPFEVALATHVARRVQSSFEELLKLNLFQMHLTDTQSYLSKSILERAINDVVSKLTCHYNVDVNRLNSKSFQTVFRVSEQVAQSIYKAKEALGGFTQWSQIQSISGLDSKHFQDAVGGLKMHSSKSPLYSTKIHPLLYDKVKDMAREHQLSVAQLLDEGLEVLKTSSRKWQEILGKDTYEHIIFELKKLENSNIKLNDRKTFLTNYNLSVHNFLELKEGLACDGWVTSVASFGAFVQIGLDKQGLLPVSEFLKLNLKIQPGVFIKCIVRSVDGKKNKFILSLHEHTKNKRPIRRYQKSFLNKKAQPPLAHKKHRSFSKEQPSSGKPKSLSKNRRRSYQAFNNPFEVLKNLRN